MREENEISSPVSLICNANELIATVPYYAYMCEHAHPETAIIPLCKIVQTQLDWMKIVC